MAKKVVLIVCGAIALLIGLPLLAGGIALLAVGGRSGTLISGYHLVSTPTTAFVADPRALHDTGDVTAEVSGATLHVDGSSAQPTFIGVGPAAQVDDFLAGATYDRITGVDFSPFGLSAARVPGLAHPAAPGDQSFWVAQASGTAPRLSWKVTDSGYLLVVMNADASTGVSLSVRMGISSSVIFESGLGLTIFGGLLALLGLLLLTWGIMAKRRPAMVPPGYPYPPGMGYPAGIRARRGIRVAGIRWVRGIRRRLVRGIRHRRLPGIRHRRLPGIRHRRGIRRPERSRARTISLERFRARAIIRPLTRRRVGIRPRPGIRRPGWGRRRPPPGMPRGTRRRRLRPATSRPRTTRCADAGQVRRIRRRRRFPERVRVRPVPGSSRRSPTSLGRRRPMNLGHGIRRPAQASQHPDLRSRRPAQRVDAGPRAGRAGLSAARAESRRPVSSPDGSCRGSGESPPLARGGRSHEGTNYPKGDPSRRQGQPNSA